MQNKEQERSCDTCRFHNDLCPDVIPCSPHLKSWQSKQPASTVLTDVENPYHPKNLKDYKQMYRRDGWNCGAIQMRQKLIEAGWKSPEEVRQLKEDFEA